MRLFFFPTVVALTFSGTAQAQTLDAPQKLILSRLINEWKAGFRSIDTLDTSWKMSGSWAWEPGERHSYQYHFWREPGRHRLNTRFYSSVNSPNNLKTSTVLGAGGYVKGLDVINSGFSRMTARPNAVQKRNPYGDVIPLIAAYAWARGEKHDYTLEEFSGDALWQDFARRVTEVKTGQWKTRRGWWLGIAPPTERASRGAQKTRVFVDEATLFPFFVGNRMQSRWKESASDTTFTVENTKTQPYLVGGKTRLLPLDSVSRVWRHDLKTGKRSIETTTYQAMAPSVINAPMAPRLWKLAIPAKTLVNYAPRADTKMADERAFYYDPQGGSLWAQNNHQRQLQAAKLRHLRALPLIYDEKADGEAQIVAAVLQAKAQNKHILLQFGAYWCSPCHVLHGLLQKDATLAPLVKDNYVSVSIDLNDGHNEAVSKRLMGSEQGGIPFLVVLDAEGKRLAAPPTEYFTPKNDQDGFDLQKIAAFLERWKPQR